jgi:hypothetical protein
MARRKNLRSPLFRDARDPGNLEAAERATTIPGKRVVRRRVLRATNGVVQRALRKVRLLS